MDRAVTDTSFLGHALIPSQLTAAAAAALDDALGEGRPLFVTPVIIVEFLSLLRKLVLRGGLTAVEADRARRRLSWSITGVLPVTEHHGHAGFVLATELGQSDTFDTTGYVVARRNDADFWVCDQRFANSSAVVGLPGVTLYL